MTMVLKHRAMGTTEMMMQDMARLCRRLEEAGRAELVFVVDFSGIEKRMLRYYPELAADPYGVFKLAELTTPKNKPWYQRGRDGKPRRY